MPKDAAYQQAEQKIQQALQSGATELDLRGSKDSKLTELPDSLWKLTQLTELNLSRNQLTTLPDSLGQLTQLTELHLSNNQLTTLPDSLGQLTRLTELDLSDNKLTTLPDSLGQLTQLTKLNLSNNKLTSLPDSLGQLTQLTELNLSLNKLTTLPPSLGQLTQLKHLLVNVNEFDELPEVIAKLCYLQTLKIGNSQHKVTIGSLPKWLNNLDKLVNLGIWYMGVTEIPSWINELTEMIGLDLTGNMLTDIPSSLAQLKYLTELYLGENQLVDLPPFLAQLEHLEKLDLDHNPLNPALQSAYAQGLDAVKAYLRSLETNAEPLYEAKLVLVGEGNVGKTTLLKALKSEKGEGAPKKDERTTHGVEIDIHGLKLPHPEKNGVEIQLNAWDFGGQDVYRVTHQFFFSRRSLYLLVWEPRRGVQQGQVEDWLNMIRLRVGDEARVIIVSTHCKTGERIARIDQPVFKQQYGDMIVGFHEVDSLVRDETTGEMVGIAELKKVIAEHAAKLEQMGMGFNRDWKAARDELLARPEPRISFGTFSGVCAARGLSRIDAETLAHLMHDLGYIVHYSDDEKLRDDVILKPEWLTKAIGFVLEDRATQDAEGILPDNHLYKVWYDHSFKNEPQYESSLYPFFLHLMEKYDVSYRLPDDRKASLVAQHVPQTRPELPWLPEDNPPEKLRRIAMICAMEEDPPGLVPWMIVRTHDYAVEQKNATGSIHRLHWQKGMFLNHGTHGTAMLEKRGREFHVYTQAAWPEYFMNVLQHTLQKLIDDNWPGLKDRYGFMVPCPEITNGQPCKGRFKIQALRQWLAEGDTTARCQECSCRVSIVELLFGFEERDMSVQLREIKEQLAGLDSRVANYFMAMMNAIADEAKNGPRLFTLRQREAGLSPKQLISRPLELQLWCEAEGHQHRVIEDGKGIYPIDQPHEWVVQIAPYATFVLNVLKTVMPIAAPAINTVMGAKTTENWKDELDLSKAILDKLPNIEASDRGLSAREPFSEVERSGILALHRFLNEVDPTQSKLGLHRVATYTGDYRWLCDYHYKVWQPNIPDVIPSH
jgi:Leucine-rich repeat (LRR) protein/GTPase SAR1 family protein